MNTRKGDKSILERIQLSAEIYGDQAAIRTSFGEITYSELWEKSNGLAAYLEERLGENKEPIIVYGHKDPLMIVCFLACVKSGRAYCPVDLSMPKNRIEEIAHTVGNPLILAVEDLKLDGFFVLGRSTIEEIKPMKENDSQYWVKDHDLFYIIFTSGSTGKPKGVQITCQNLSRFVDWSIELTDRKRHIFLNQAPFSFDLSVLDLYTCLACGGRLVCLDKGLQSDMSNMFAYLNQANISCWVSTPSFADLCLADRNFNQDLLPKMELFLFCGERLTRDTVLKLMDRFPGAKIMNLYGPTESTVAVSGVEITKGMLEEEGTLPIGFAKPGSILYIDNGENIGEEGCGEILILGDTVSPGYFKDPEKTEAAFGIWTDNAGNLRTYYRTGDEGYFHDGMLYYKGRIDLQVKVHGYRIELGDIEANMMEFPEIEAAAVVPRRTGDKIRNLVAFVKSASLAGTLADAKLLKLRLKEKLPAYMIPKNIVFVEALPMTANGKTDRKKLEMQLR